MTNKTITNPGGLWGATGDTDPEVKWYLNNSGGTLHAGDLVVVAADTTGTKATTTTTASDVTVLGVVAPADPSSLDVDATAYASGATMPVIVKGPARIQIGANTVAAGGQLASTTTAKQAGTPGAAATVGALQALLGSFIGVALEAQTAKDANNCIRAYIQRF